MSHFNATMHQIRFLLSVWFVSVRLSVFVLDGVWHIRHNQML